MVTSSGIESFNFLLGWKISAWLELHKLKIISLEEPFLAKSLFKINSSPFYVASSGSIMFNEFKKSSKDLDIL